MDFLNIVSLGYNKPMRGQLFRVTSYVEYCGLVHGEKLYSKTDKNDKNKYGKDIFMFKIKRKTSECLVMLKVLTNHLYSISKVTSVV